MTLEQQQAVMMAQALSGGGAGGDPFGMGMVGGGSNRAATPYNMVVDQNSFTWQMQARRMMSIMMAQSMGYENALPVPAATYPTMGLSQSLYAERVTSRQWEQMQSGLRAAAAQGFANDVGAIANMGLPKALGVKPGAFRDMVSQGAATEAGRNMIGKALASPLYQNMIGGDLEGSYKTLFRNRNSILRPDDGGALSLRDEGSHANVMTDIGHISYALEHLIRGRADGSFGALPDYKFTQGLRDEHVADIAADLGQSGAFGNIGGQLNLVRRTTANNPEDQHAAAMGVLLGNGSDLNPGALKVPLQQSNAMFKTLMEIMNSDDMVQLKDTMSKLAGKNWTSMTGGERLQLNNNLRNMQATADVLNIGGDEVVHHALTMSKRLQAVSGVSDTMLALGFNAGAGTIATQLTNYDEAAADAAGYRTPEQREAYHRVNGENRQMYHLSRYGKMATAAAWATQTGLLNGDDYHKFIEAVKGGDTSDIQNRSIAVAESFGGKEAFERIIQNPQLAQRFQQELSNEGKFDVEMAGTIGRPNEFNQRMRRNADTHASNSMTAIMRAGSMRFATDPNTAAGQWTSAFVAMLGTNKDVAGGKDYYTGRIADLRASGASEVDVQRQILSEAQRDPSVRGELGKVSDVARHAKTQTDSEAVGKYGAAGARFQAEFGVIQGNMSLYTDDMRQQINPILTLSSTDPNAALEQLHKIVVPDSVKQEMARRGGNAARITEKQVALARDKATASDLLAKAAYNKINLDYEVSLAPPGVKLAVAELTEAAKSELHVTSDQHEVDKRNKEHAGTTVTTLNASSGDAASNQNTTNNLGLEKASAYQLLVEAAATRDTDTAPDARQAAFERAASQPFTKAAAIKDLRTHTWFSRSAKELMATMGAGTVYNSTDVIDNIQKQVFDPKSAINKEGTPEHAAWVKYNMTNADRIAAQEKPDEKASGKGKGGKDAPMKISGTLTLVDPVTNKSRKVLIDGNEEGSN